MAEGIVDDTVGVVEKYPVWILGGLLVAVLLFWYLSGSGSNTQSNAGQFTFSYGPSDAQVTAGAAEQVAQTQAMQAATVAQTNATAATGIAGDYYNYLTTNSANTLAGTVNTNSVTQAVGLAAIGANLSEAQIAGTTAQITAKAQAQASAAAAQAQASAAAAQTAAAIQIAQMASDNQEYATGAAMQIANMQAVTGQTITGVNPH